MELAFRIARKYFLSKKEKHFINVISILSMITLAVGTASLFIILSVFNGLHSIMNGVHHAIDSELTIKINEGKTLIADSTLLEDIKNTEGVSIITEVIEDEAFTQYEGGQKVVHIKGVSDNYREQNNIDTLVFSGTADISNKDIPKTFIGRGVQYELNIKLNSNFKTIEVWYPKRKQKIIRASKNSFNRINVLPVGVFEIERTYDASYLFVPLSSAKKLFDYDLERTSIEIKTDSNISITEVKQNLENKLGDKYKILESEELHSSLYKAAKVERFIAYLIFVFILTLASLNIFLTLTIIVISKKKDISILVSMGATKSFIRKIFLAKGFLIGATGTFAGLILGVGIILGQQTFGFVGMNVQSSLVDAFPVKMEVLDIVLTGTTTLIITILLSIQPAIKASNFSFKKD
ncbi:MAG: FtsX-like permease family protein [Cytophagales bacterium]|nr:FtsX-like permease family protein [Cytophagales bacterium]